MNENKSAWDNPFVQNFMDGTIEGLFHPTYVNKYIRFRTPFILPDGTVIDIFIDEQTDHFIITDLGETVRWVKDQHPTMYLSEYQNTINVNHRKDVCLTHGLEFVNGVLFVKTKSTDNYAAVMLRLIQGIIRIAEKGSRAYSMYHIEPIESEETNINNAKFREGKL